MKKNKCIIFIFFTVLFFVFILFIPSGTAVSKDTSGKKQETQKNIKKQTNPYANAKITIKIIPSVNKTFGYDIFLDGKLLVHQPHIPAVPGNKGFTTKERAQKVAEFVVKKIRKNEMPPTVTIDNLNNLGVLK
jgi:hypothetical protein